MERTVGIPCLVAARVLWRVPYAPAILVVGGERRLVWAERKDLLLDPQRADTDELAAIFLADFIREDEGDVVVSLRSRGIPTELRVPRSALRPVAASA